MCTHKRDGLWTTDLLWHYLHEVKTPAPPQGSWHTKLDPLNELSNRHRVYELLVDEPAHTFPGTKALSEASKIPWNQLNTNLQHSCEKLTKQKYACGTIVKVFFQRYMGWGANEKSYEIKKRGFDAVKWVIQRLERKSPVRMALSGAHYIGIVGHRCIRTPMPAGMEGPEACSANHEFLAIDPWPFGTNVDHFDMVYAGTHTGFLQIVRQVGTTWTYQHHKPSHVEGFE